MPQLSKINRWAVAGLAAAALAPASAAAIPIGGPVAPGASATHNVGPQQDWRAPDQVAPATAERHAPGPPTWPTNPQTLTPPKATTTTASPSDDGIDAGVLIAIGGAAAIGVAGLGVARRKRVTAVRRQQPA
jgi:hypothetical protein